jgi:hypothetical protein
VPSAPYTKAVVFCASRNNWRRGVDILLVARGFVASPKPRLDALRWSEAASQKPTKIVAHPRTLSR